MAKEKDITERTLEDYNDVFADIVNTVGPRPAGSEQELRACLRDALTVSPRLRLKNHARP